MIWTGNTKKDAKKLSKKKYREYTETCKGKHSKEREMIKIIKFLYREKDGCSYVLYEINNKLYLTNGMIVWGDNVEEKVSQLTEDDRTDVSKVVSNLKKYYPYASILKELVIVLNKKN